MVNTLLGIGIVVAGLYVVTTARPKAALAPVTMGAGVVTDHATKIAFKQISPTSHDFDDSTHAGHRVPIGPPL